jgi:Zn-dependent protease
MIGGAIVEISSGDRRVNRQTIPLGRVLGIPIGVHYSWFLVFALLTWVLAASYYPAEFQGWPTNQYWILGAVTAILLFVSVLVHELGHAVVALYFQIPVRRITLFIFGGVAEISTKPLSASVEFWIAIAGPMVSLALAGILRLLQPILADIVVLLALAEYLALVNCMLALFNLIPGFPLDGGRVVRAVVWGVTHKLRKATLIAANLGRGVSFLFIVLGVWQMVVGSYGTGLWIVLIGWFLETTARAEVQRQETQGLLSGHHVSVAMSTGCPIIATGTTLQQLVDQHVRGRGQRSFVIERDDGAVGLLTLHQIKEVPRSEWATTTAGQVMIPVAQMKRVRPDTELWTVFQKMDRDGVSQLPVMANGQILGMLTREGISSYLRTLREVGA